MASVWKSVQRSQAHSIIRRWLKVHDSSYVTWSEFSDKCHGVGLNDADRVAFLRNLELSGCITYNNGVLNLRPEKVWEEVNSQLGIGQRRHHQKLKDLKTEFTALEAEKYLVDEKLERSRQRLWARTAAFCGAQMWVFARFTFVDFDWDTMEPISYLTMQANAVLFFIYFWRHQREHSHIAFDDIALTKSSLAAYQKYDFNIRRWATVKKEIDYLTSEQERRLRHL
eukprot:TRINITY_DN4149_c1_g1_i2.p1 TRINITY_DN4149_c1_g1~~TRINITY_DN4149_c1_g1_i2.p1  ORF type:complete len:226 (+),score=26.28 TRINITY_DN4149_c1_g1_i2:45-722(+)